MSDDVPEVGNGERVLVLEDDDAILGMLERLLARAGYQATLTQRVQDALKEVRSGTFTAAILDKNLPGGTGLDVMRLLSSTQPNCKVIILTAHVDSSSAIDALRIGAFDYLAKPISPVELVARVHQAVTASQTQAQTNQKMKAFELKVDALLDEYQWFVDMIPGIVFFHTREGRFEALNVAGANMLGYEPGELVGQHYETLLPPVGQRPDDVKWAFEERRTGERATNRRPVQLKTKDGDLRIFEMSSRAAVQTNKDDGRRIEGTLGVGYDVTDHAILQAQLRESQKMEAIGRMAGGIAHDFNNMLNVIDANVLLLLGTTEGEDRDMLTEIGEATRRASVLIKQLLTFSGNQQDEELSLIRPGRLLQKLEPLIDRLIGEDVHVTLEVAEDLDVKASRGGLDQILMNLAANARDAMPDGGTLTIRVSVQHLTAPDLRNTAGMVPGAYALLEVIDQGRGMTESVRERVFEPFFTTKHPDRGTGLGLSVVFGTVRQWGGRVEVSSAPGKGTSVRVYLPAAESAASLVRPDSGRFRPSPPRAEEESYAARILVVEDERLVRVVLRRTMEQAGYFVDEAGDGEEALAMLRASDPPYDLLVTDVIMPFLDGAELAKTGREENPRLSVVYFSGYVGERLGRHELLSEHATFVEKPVTAFNLLRAIHQLLDVRRKRDEHEAVRGFDGLPPELEPSSNEGDPSAEEPSEDS